MIILDNVKHGFNFRQPNTQNLFIILPTSLMWIMEEFCVCFTFMYVLCIDCTFHRLFISAILSDRKIKSPKNNFAEFIMASRINQGFV